MRILIFPNFWISDFSRILIFTNFANSRKLVPAKISIRKNQYLLWIRQNIDWKGKVSAHTPKYDVFKNQWRKYKKKSFNKNLILMFTDINFRGYWFSRILIFENFRMSDISRVLIFANFANSRKLVPAKINIREN